MFGLLALFVVISNRTSRTPPPRRTESPRAESARTNPGSPIAPVAPAPAPAVESWEAAFRGNPPTFDVHLTRMERTIQLAQRDEAREAFDELNRLASAVPTALKERPDLASRLTKFRDLTRRLADLPAPPPPPGVTLANYLRLRDGMRYSEVVAILGEAGTEMSRSDLGGITTVMYSWQGEGSLGANMNAMFQGGKMVSKAQFGLK